jgi:hypothetical protein
MNICDPRQSIVFEQPPLAYGIYIQRMDITIWNCVLADTLEDMLLTPGSGWYYLLIPRAHCASIHPEPFAHVRA